MNWNKFVSDADMPKLVSCCEQALVASRSKANPIQFVADELHERGLPWNSNSLVRKP